MLMTLGLFVWGINTLTYQELQRSTSWRFGKNNRVGKRPVTQFLGPGDDTINLSGWISAELAGDTTSLDQLRVMADEGKPYVLVGGTGAVFGLWQITSITETGTLFYPNGNPRKISFNLTIRRTDDDQIDQIGLITDVQELLR